MFLLPSESWYVKRTKSTGLGIFTKEKIHAGTVIGDYLGRVIKTADYDIGQDRLGLFLMYYTDTFSIYPDIQKPGIHLINHSCTPNCWIYIHRGHTLFFSLRDIAPDEELTISYLLSPKDETCNPCTHICACESTTCTGTMHLSKGKYDRWQVFQKAHKLGSRVAPCKEGKYLPELSHYPTQIPIDPIYASIIE